jgi:hypothetical protein
MSGLPPIATELRTSLVVRFVPNSEVGLSLDHFVNSSEETGRHGNAERFGGPKVDDELEFRWLHYGHIGRLFSFKGRLFAQAQKEAYGS